MSKIQTFDEWLAADPILRHAAGTGIAAQLRQAFRHGMTTAATVCLQAAETADPYEEVSAASVCRDCSDRILEESRRSRRGAA